MNDTFFLKNTGSGEQGLGDVCSTKPLTLAGIGCGGRTRSYMELAAKQPDRYRVVAAADPVTERRERIAKLSRNPDFRSFRDADEILREPRLADIMVIGTQDSMHREHAIAAMEMGYDLLLEKPIATTLDDVLEMKAVAHRLNRRVLVCHVLRYTPFYTKVKEVLESGVLGQIITMNATEGVGPWHQAHSYVRGHWAVTGQSSPMILAKSCHDMDIIRWLVDKPCLSVSSFGELSYFRRENVPEGAPLRCMDGCPVGDVCLFNAERYLTDEKSWLRNICDLDLSSDDKTLGNWVHQSPWGRCVYQCDNDAVDHQTVNLRFSQGITVTFTMTAFTSGRHLQIYGSKGELHGSTLHHVEGGPRLVFKPHDPSARQVEFDPTVRSDEGYAGHGGGDQGLIDALYDEMRRRSPADMTSSISVSVESHRMAFAAEESRVTGRTVTLPSEGVSADTGM